MTTEDLIKRISALPEKERMECIKNIFILCDAYEKMDSFIKNESIEERQSHLKASDLDYENKYRVSEEVMSAPFNI
jgi:predicted GTPase